MASLRRLYRNEFQPLLSPDSAADPFNPDDAGLMFPPIEAPPVYTPPPVEQGAPIGRPPERPGVIPAPEPAPPITASPAVNPPATPPPFASTREGVSVTQPQFNAGIEPGRTYQPMPGFDTTRLNTPTDTSTKYIVARIIQNMGLPPTAESVQTIARELAARGIQAPADADILRFADWPQDVVRDLGGPNAAWQFLNVPGATTPPLSTPPPSGSPTPTVSGPSSSHPSVAPPNLEGLGHTYGGPQSAGIFSGPTQQVGQDPLSQLLTGGLAELILNRGKTGSALSAATDQALIDRLSRSPQDLALRLETARVPFDRARKAQLSQLEAELADRGLLSAPGAPSGAQASTLARLEESLAGPYSQAIRQAMLDQSQTDLQTLQTATGASAQDAQTMLAAINAGTNRQQMLSTIALQTLHENIAWNEFLASFGLQRDQVEYQIAQGNLGLLLPLLNAFLSATNISTGGFIGRS